VRQSFGNMFVVDNYALLFKGVLPRPRLFVLLVSYRYFPEFRTYQGEYYFLLLSAFLGMMLMPSARDLVMLFIALELCRVPGFVMAALRKFDLRSNEGALKFFLIGVLSVAVLLFGLSIVYGYTGTTDLEATAAALADAPRDPLLLAACCSSSSASVSRSRPCRSTSGRPTPTRARRSPSPRSCRCVEGRRLRRAAPGVLHRLRAARRRVGAGPRCRRRPHDDAREPDALQQTQHRAPARLLLGGPRRLHAGAVRLVQTGNEEREPRQAFSAVLIYLLAYAVMNIGAFACLTAVARRHPGRLTRLRRPRGALTRPGGGADGCSCSPSAACRRSSGFWAKFFIFWAAVPRPGRRRATPSRPPSSSTP
jgi:NADH-quinone oxidoreductase subunit N